MISIRLQTNQEKLRNTTFIYYVIIYPQRAWWVATVELYRLVEESIDKVDRLGNAVLLLGRPRPETRRSTSFSTDDNGSNM